MDILALLQIDTKIPLWGVITFGLVWSITGVWQIIKLHFSDKESKKTIDQIFKELEHVRTRHKIEMDLLRINSEKEIIELKAVIKESNHEMRELRDMIQKMSAALDIIALKDLRTRSKAA